MKKNVLLITITAVMLAVLLPFFSSGIEADNQETPTTEAGKLWPAIQPYKTGHLRVSEIHNVFYQLGGNPKGKPVMVLHGGPGAGCTPGYFRYFNPEKYHIILHDQRGCGLSTPYGELKQNTTQNLVEDIEKLRTHLNLGKVVLFGGSWGSTLALAYAETYPQNVSAMILRGIFTSTKEEIDHFYHGGTALFFPENYNKLISTLDEPNKPNVYAQLLEKLKSPDPAVREKYAHAWAWYESKIAFLDVSDQAIDNFFKTWKPYAFSVLENYYMTNRCFLEEGQLFNHADKLADIPVVLINGRYDMVCPPITAYKLHQKLPKSKLVIVEKAGHSSNEPGIESQLVLAAKEFE